jgi:hypothetical protein
LGVKSLGSTEEWRSKPPGLRETEVSGTDGGAVKCVDIIRNTGGEGGSLGLF